MPPTVRPIALNIETMATLALVDTLPEPEVKLGNTKDPEKVAAKKDAAHRKLIDQMALDPFFAQTICATLAVADDAGKIKPATVTSIEHGEATLLAWIWEQIAAEGVQLITFNGARFDIPFIMARSLLLRVPAAKIEMSPYKTTSTENNHCDVMLALQQLDGPLNIPRGLRFYAKQILGESFPFGDLDQSTFAQQLEGVGMVDGVLPPGTIVEKVVELCEWNTTRTMALFNSIRLFL